MKRILEVGPFINPMHHRYGDRSDIPFEDGTFDELVSLGSFANEVTNVSEFRRVLKPGGILRLGIGAQHSQELMNTWGARLQRLGFTFVEEQTQNYRYQRGKNYPGMDYVVLVFRKGS